MKSKKTNKMFKKTKRTKSSKPSFTIFNPKRLKKLHLLIFVLIFANLGTYLLIFSSAATVGFVPSAESEHLYRIGAERARHELPSHTTSGCLTNAARQRAQWMGERLRLEHPPDLLGDVDRACTAESTSMVENAGRGPGSSEIMQAFLNSVGHHANIDSTNWNFKAVGAYRASNGELFVIQIFVKCIGCSSKWHETPPANFKLSNSISNPVTNHDFTYGYQNDTMLMCDWDGNGTDTPGVFRGGVWKLRNSNSTGAPHASFSYGLSTDKPVCGDWDGNGTDTPGVFRGGKWYLRNSNSGGNASIPAFSFGRSGDTPVVGDWNDDGRDTIGVWRARQWYLRNANSAGPAHHEFDFGSTTDRPVVGDWNGDGRDTIGVFRSSYWFLRNQNLAGGADVQSQYGMATDKPLTGDWNNDNKDTVGIWR